MHRHVQKAMFTSHSHSFHVLRSLSRPRWSIIIRLGISTSSRRHNLAPRTCSPNHVTSLENDQRSRLSKIWAPSGGIATNVDEDAHSKLIRAGFLRQAHSGIFHMLPLGYRVQKKVERLIDRHMYNLNASKLDLSSISSEELWTRSSRLQKVGSELFLFKDRKDTSYLLSPTHEEEITSLVASATKSYKELPIRLYQISRKYRDELRPRHGLLRSREFIMKDLYTFDSSKKLAIDTYNLVRKAYAAVFDELKIPYLIAEADSGDMGGTLSHEFQFLTSKGEDRVISCRSCDYVANEELARAAISDDAESHSEVEWSFVGLKDQLLPSSQHTAKAFSVWRGISQDRTTLVNVWHPLLGSNSTRTAWSEINTHAVKRIVPNLDPGIENAVALWKLERQLASRSKSGRALAKHRIVNLVDCRLPRDILENVDTEQLGLPALPEFSSETINKIMSSNIFEDPLTLENLNLLRVQEGDRCPRCNEGLLDVNVAIELGHTFFLGTRYSEPFNAAVAIPRGASGRGDDTPAERMCQNRRTLMQMGCHGIGVSRMIGAVAETLVDEAGLNWPRVIAPYEVVIVPTLGNELGAVSAYDALVHGLEVSNITDQTLLDVVLDDRDSPFPWKMKDADLIGYPVIVVVGKSWKDQKTFEVQCRRLGIRKNVPFEQLRSFVLEILARL